MELDGILKAWTKKVLINRAMTKAIIKASAYSRAVPFFLAFVIEVFFAMVLSPVDSYYNEGYLFFFPYRSGDGGIYVGNFSLFPMSLASLFASSKVR